MPSAPILTGIVLLWMCLPGASADPGEAPLSSSPKSLLWEVRQAHGRGDFALAWDAYLRFFRHPDRNEVDIMAFGSCFGWPECPDFAYLGAFLGKSRGELEALDEFCPEWKEFGKNSLPNDRKYIPMIRHNMRVGALNGNCAQWRSRALRILHERPVRRESLRPQIVPLRLAEIKPEFYEPQIEIQIGEADVWALVDTGSTFVHLKMDETRSEELSALNLEVVAEDEEQVTWHGKKVIDTLRGPDIRIGAAVFEGILLGVDETMPDMGAEALVGMNILLRYDSVCFAWNERELHLGDLGPCRQGKQPYSAYISPFFVPRLEIPAEHGLSVESHGRTWRLSPGVEAEQNWKPATKVFRILVDTGADDVHCSGELLSAGGQNRRFSFGEDGLTAVCAGDSDDVLLYKSDAYLGMKTLLNFDAFGWELNPLKIYFVPKAPDA